MTNKYIMNNLDQMILNPKCELNYQKDYELLIATVLSAQATDNSVNKVTEFLFKEYDLESLSKENLSVIENKIKSIGTYKRKAYYIKELAKRLIIDHQGIVPNDRDYLESLPGVGRKTTNVVLSNLFNYPAIAVDTHVSRVSKRLEIANLSDDVYEIEKKLMGFFPKDKWIRIHHQLVLFGRYICKSKNPNCKQCLFNEKCKYSNIIKNK